MTQKLGENLTRADHRELRKLASLVDKATDSDRLFFERHPDRDHRIRRSHRAEVREQELIGGRPLPTLPGWRWFTAVRNLCSGYRMRLLIDNVADAEVDLPEEVCAQTFAQLETAQTREIEAVLRSVACKEAAQ